VPNPENAPTVAELLAAGLKRHRITTVFGQSIPSGFHLAAGDLGINQIVYRTENAGAIMADAFARISRTLGVVTAQNGPAATLLVPGLAEAFKASVPILALVQDVPVTIADKNAFQELDQIELFKSCTKWVRRVTDGDRINDYLDMAIVAALSQRPGPVALLLPMDVLSGRSAARTHRSDSSLRFPLDRTRPTKDALELAAEAIAVARAPLLVAGGGVHLSGACEIVARLQEEVHLPVATTMAGRGTVADAHPLSIGMIGNVMGRRAAARHMRPLVEDADLIVLVGTRTNQNGTDSWTLFRNAREIIHVDIDSQEVGRNYESRRLVGDAQATLEALLPAILRFDMSMRLRQRASLEGAIAAARRRHQAESADVCSSDSIPIRPERVMADVERLRPDNAILVADASYSSVWVTNYLQSRRAGSRFLTPRGLAGLGWGLPMAIGAACAAPTGTPVLCFVGDGAFAHMWGELETARRLNSRIVLTVFNNGVLGFQKEAENVRFGRHTIACHIAPIDHAKIAEACGCIGIRVEQPNAYAEALSFALNADRPVVIDVITDPAAYPPVTVFDKLDDQIAPQLPAHDLTWRT
jgi:acetolactate synthase-1/2/3 large subunit